MAEQASREGYRDRGVASSRDVLLLALDAAEQSLRQAIADISAAEYTWEPIPEAEQAADRQLPTHRKRVWRVYQAGDAWIYDYTPEELRPPPFTTIAWIMNHIAQTADMYLYCVQTGKAEGIDRHWEDLPVPCSCEAMRTYLHEVLAGVWRYLVSLPEEGINRELNRPSPAPWGEMRPTYLSIWGGVIEHAIAHAAQISARKDRIRYGH